MSIKYGLEYVGHIDPWTDEERLSDEGLCVQKYEDTADYGELRVVDFGATACDEWRG